MNNGPIFESLKCPFWLNQKVEAIPGKTTVPEYSAELEIHDRVECVLVIPNKLMLPMAVNGTVRGIYGLVQVDETERCGYCGIPLYSSISYKL